MDWYKEMLEEHMVVLEVVDALRRHTKAVEDGKPLPKKMLGDILFLIKNFADRCHHAKEEKVLFPLLRTKPAKDGSMVDTLLAEHEQGRAFARMMGNAGKEDALEGAHGYCDLLLKHVFKENRFFKECDLLMSQEERARVSEGFGRIEKEMGEGEHEKYHKMAQELSEAAKKL